MEKGLSLYAMTAGMVALLESEEELTPEALEEAFGAIEKKGENLCHFIRNVEGAVDTFKAEEKRISDRRKAMENVIKRSKEYAQICMERLEVDKLTAGTFTLAIQNNPPALDIEEGVEPPAEYCVIIPEQRTWDKAKVKDDLKAGKEITGCSLRRGRSLRIR